MADTRYKPLQPLYQDFKKTSPPDPARLFEVFERLDGNLKFVYNSIVEINNRAASQILVAYAQMTTTNTLTLKSDASKVAITFDTKIVDTGNFWDSSANTKFKIPKDGNYLVFYTAPSAAAPTFQTGGQGPTITTGPGVSYSTILNFGPAYFQIRKNGSAVFAGSYGEGHTWQTSAGGFGTYTDIGQHASGFAMINFKAGDYIELIAWQNYSGAADSNFTYPPSVTASQVPSMGIMGPI